MYECLITLFLLFFIQDTPVFIKLRYSRWCHWRGRRSAPWGRRRYSCRTPTPPPARESPLTWRRTSGSSGWWSLAWLGSWTLPARTPRDLLCPGKQVGQNGASLEWPVYAKQFIFDWLLGMLWMRVSTKRTKLYSRYNFSYNCNESQRSSSDCHLFWTLNHIVKCFLQATTNNKS